MRTISDLGNGGRPTNLPSRVSKDLCPADKRPLLQWLETVMAFRGQMG
jgi:hypothetical protein